MARVDLKVLVVVLVMSVVIVRCQNKTSPAAAPSRAPSAAPSKASSAPPKEPSKPGALASLAKMFIDIPMGIVEALKDGAEAIESVVVALMRGIFKP